MSSLYTEEELHAKLTNLLNQKDLVQKNRVALLKKYTSKATIAKKEVEQSEKAHRLDLQIEELERRIEKFI